MRRSVRSRSCTNTTSRTAKTTTSASGLPGSHCLSFGAAANGRYNKLCGSLRSLIHRISLLPANDPFRAQKEGEMLNKLYDMGILGASGCRGLKEEWGEESWRLVETSGDGAGRKKGLEMGGRGWRPRARAGR